MGSNQDFMQAYTVPGSENGRYVGAGYGDGLPADPRQRSLAMLALKAAESQFTVAEYSALAQDLAQGKIDVRVYDDGIVIMRTAH